MPGKNVVGLRDILAGAGGPGVVWTLEESGDLNANLVRFPAGDGVGEHVNDEVDVLVLGVSGAGTVRVEGEEHALAEGTLVVIPRGTSRSTRSEADDFAYLTVHRRRGPVRLGSKPESSGHGEER